MTSRPIRPTMTNKRRRWLERLRDGGPSVAGSVVGYQCRKLGWTEWFVTLKDGRAMPVSEAETLFPDRPSMWAEIARPSDVECITKEGLAALERISP